MSENLISLQEQDPDQSGKKNNFSEQNQQRGVITFDEALDLAGSSNWYQIRCFIIFMLEWFITAHVLLVGPFILPTPTFKNCPGMTDSQCQTYVCDNIKHHKSEVIQYVKFPTRWSSATEKYELYCDRNYLNTIGQSITYFGSLCGFFLFSYIADNFGRKFGLVSSWISATVGVILMATSADYWMFAIGNGLAGFGLNPAITLHYSFITEQVKGKMREYQSIAIQIAFAAGELLMVLECYYYPSWRYYTIFTLAIPVFLLNFAHIFIFETPKFVYEKEGQKAIEILSKIARVNHKEGLEGYTLEVLQHDKTEKQFSVIDLFRYKSIRLMSYAASFVFFSIQAVYYGVSYAMSEVGLGLYINTAVIGSFEFLSYCVTDMFIPHIKRKTTAFIGLGLSVFFSLLFQIFPIEGQKCDNGICYQKIIQIILSGLLRFDICSVWTVIYVYFSELFPTQVRSLALGFTSATGTIGSIGAPYLVVLCNSVIHINPLVSLAVIGAAGFFHIIPLTETKDKPMKNKIDELAQGTYEQLQEEN